MQVGTSYVDDEIFLYEPAHTVEDLHANNVILFVIVRWAHACSEGQLGGPYVL